MKKLMAISLMVTAFLFGASAAFAAANPQGTGQPGAPNVSCGSGNAVVQPNGLTTNGFSHAAGVYAGSPGTPSAKNAQSPHALSQYDIACYQQTANH